MKSAFVVAIDTGETDVTKCIRCGKTKLCYHFKTVYDDPKIIGPGFWICPACRETGRDCIGFEKDPKYESIIRERALMNIPELSNWS